MRISRKVFYPWYKRSKVYPWERGYADWEFLKTERFRVNKCREWYDEFLKARIGSKLGEVVYYAVPARLPEGWQSGEYEYIGLSALRNSPQVPLIALFPKDKVPQDYSLIRIISSKKSAIFNLNLPNNYNTEYALEVEEFEELPADHFYKDVPFDKKLITEVLQDSLGHDKYVARSLKTPLLSSPFVMGRYGGIGLASMMSESTFVDELLKQLQLMLPPEYRSINPPTTVTRGEWISPTSYGKSSMQFRFAEKFSQNAKVGSSVGYKYNVVDDQWQKRLSFNGEYSFLSSVVYKGKTSEVYEEMMDKFTKTEVTAFYLDKLKESDVLLKDLSKHIDENVWLNIAYSRQFNPVVKDTHMNSWKNKIRNDWEAFFPEMGYTDSLDFVKDMKVKQTMKNIIRIAQANARGNSRGEVTEKDLKEARQIFTTSAEEFIDHQITRRAKKIKKKSKQQNRIESIKEVLNTGTFSVKEMWENLKRTGYYKDRKDFESVLRWLHKKGHVYKLKEGYSWI